MISEKDIEYQDLGPGKGGRITLSGETAKQVIAEAKKRRIDPSDMLLACIEAFIKDPHLQAEVA